VVAIPLLGFSPFMCYSLQVTYYFKANLLLVIDNLMSFYLVEASFVVEGICLAEALVR
jgi:hypothetical protein